MATAKLIERQRHRRSCGLTGLVVASALLGSGCGQTGPLASTPLADGSRVSPYDALLLFPAGPDHHLSAEAEATLPGLSLVARDTPSLPLLATFPPSFDKALASRSPDRSAGRPPRLRLADERIQPGSGSTVR